MTAFGGSCRTATMPLMTAVRTEQTFAGLAPTGASGPNPTFVQVVANGWFEPKLTDTETALEAEFSLDQLCAV